MKSIRKILVLALVVCMAFGIASCAKSAEVQPIQSGTVEKENQYSTVEPSAATEPVQESASANNTLVVYFSATGTTKGVAEKIAKLVKAELYEIVPAEPYSDADLDYTDRKSRASIESDDPQARPAIGGEPVSFEGYSTIYLGYPIWNADAPRIISTFVESHDFEGITVIAFCTSGSSGIGNSADNIAKQAGSGNWLPGQRFDGGVSEADLQSWIDGLQQ